LGIDTSWFTLLAGSRLRAAGCLFRFERQPAEIP
jgi:hypothetical protein